MFACLFDTTNISEAPCTCSFFHLDLSSNEVQILVSGVGESATTVLADLHESQSFQVVKAVTDDVSVSLRISTYFSRANIHDRGTGDGLRCDDDHRKHHAKI